MRMHSTACRLGACGQHRLAGQRLRRPPETPSRLRGSWRDSAAHSVGQTGRGVAARRRTTRARGRAGRQPQPPPSPARRSEMNAERPVRAILTGHT